MSSRRSIAAVLAAACAVALAAAMPSLAATKTKPTAPTVTTTLKRSVAKSGSYAVVVTVTAPAAATTVNVTLGAQSQRSIAVSAGHPAALAFYARLPHRAFTVRAVGASPVRLAVAATRQPAPLPHSGAAGWSGTGTTGGDDRLYLGPSVGPYNRLVWSDEFNGPAGTPPDPSNWTADSDGGCGGGSLSTSTQSPANASLDGHGNLAITAYENGASAGQPSFTTAQLDTNGKVSWRYGELEARIELPTGSGLCSGFWMVGDSPSGGCFPQCGEIDVMEAIATMPSTVFGTLHGPFGGSSNSQEWQQAVSAPSPLTGQWHTFGLIWQPQKLTWTLDGVPYATATPASLPTGAQWVFDSNSFHILLDLAVGGWPGPPANDATFPQTLRVDWVRLYD